MDVRVVRLFNSLGEQNKLGLRSVSRTDIRLFWAMAVEILCDLFKPLF